MTNYNERLLDRKIAKKLKSTGGILLKGVRFCGKTTTSLHHAASFVRLDESELIREQATLKLGSTKFIDEAADNLQKLLTRLTPEKAAQCASLNILIAGVSSYTLADNVNVVSLGHLYV